MLMNQKNQSINKGSLKEELLSNCKQDKPLDLMMPDLYEWFCTTKWCHVSISFYHQTFFRENLLLRLIFFVIYLSHCTPRVKMHLLLPWMYMLLYTLHTCYTHIYTFMYVLNMCILFCVLWKILFNYNNKQKVLKLSGEKRNYPVRTKLSGSLSSLVVYCVGL